MTNTLISLVGSYGLIAIFITMAGESCGLPISSEIVVPLGGALVSQGKLGSGVFGLGVVILVASLANLTGSLIAFYLTRRYGEAFVLSRLGKGMGLHRGHLRLANRFFNRFGLWAVFVGRLLPIVRTYISFPAGVAKMGYVTFSVATMAGAIPWNLVLAYAGYKLGQHYQQVATTMSPFAIPLAVVVVALLAALWYFGRRLGEDEAGDTVSAAAR
jgi:membrane protein DedA with SNARE-associated domain